MFIITTGHDVGQLVSHYRTSILLNIPSGLYPLYTTGGMSHSLEVGHYVHVLQVLSDVCM